MLMLCYNAASNKFFRTDDRMMLRDSSVCRATQGIDNTLIIEKWTLSDTGEEVLYKRTGTAIYENTTSVNYNRESYFANVHNTTNKYITQIILPPELFTILNINAPIYSSKSDN